MKMKSESTVKIFDFIGGPIIMATIGALFVLETRYGLRKRKLPRWLRLRTNTALAATAALTLRLAFIPAMVQIAIYTKKHHLGLLRQLPLGRATSFIISFLALDYGNYRWHKLNHSVNFLWRFHQVHHADLDLDLSTALRFHVGEILASVLYRGLWVVGLGTSASTVLVYEIFFETATNFHHSNLKFPLSIEKVLSKIIVTPRMHGIHHSIVQKEADSNFCIILSLWDRLHRTLRLNIPQEQIEIGIPYVRKHLTTLELLKMPIYKLPEWKLPDGRIPEREQMS